MKLPVAFAIAALVFLTPACHWPPPAPPPPCPNAADAGPCGQAVGQACCPGPSDDAGNDYPPVCATGLNCDPPGFLGICIACGEPGQPCCRAGGHFTCAQTSCSNLTGHCAAL